MQRCFFLEIPDLKNGGGAFGDETGRFLQDGLAVVIGHQQRVCEIYLVFCTRQGNIPEPAFFLFAVDLAERTRAGKFALGGPDDKDRFPFQAFCLVDACQGQKLVLIGGGYDFFADERLRFLEPFGREQVQARTEIRLSSYTAVRKERAP